MAPGREMVRHWHYEFRIATARSLKQSGSTDESHRFIDCHLNGLHPCDRGNGRAAAS
jgi:hypothetical protein